MRQSALLAVTVILCAGAADAQVPLSSEHGAESSWSRMNIHTFAPNYSEMPDGCLPLADASSSDPLERTHCALFKNRLLGAGTDCMSTMISTRLSDGTPRVLDFVAERSGGRTEVKMRAAMDLPLSTYPATVCSLGVSRGYDVVGIIFDDPTRGCFNPAFVFVPVPAINDTLSGRIPVISNLARSQDEVHEAPLPRGGFPYRLDCVPDTVNHFNFMRAR